MRPAIGGASAPVRRSISIITNTCDVDNPAWHWHAAVVTSPDCQTRRRPGTDGESGMPEIRSAVVIARLVVDRCRGGFSTSRRVGPPRCIFNPPHSPDVGVTGNSPRLQPGYCSRVIKKACHRYEVAFDVQ